MLRIITSLIALVPMDTTQAHITCCHNFWNTFP